jgi:amino acid transporter
MNELYSFEPALGAYGEAEFIFASIKVLTITGTRASFCHSDSVSHADPRVSPRAGLIILGIILDLGGGPDHERLGFRYWKHPGPFVQFDNIDGSKGRFLGFSQVLTQAAFSYIGTEIVAVSLIVDARRVYVC